MIPVQRHSPEPCRPPMGWSALAWVGYFLVLYVAYQWASPRFDAWWTHEKLHGNVASVLEIMQ